MRKYPALLAAVSLLGTAAVSDAGQRIISTSLRTGVGTAGACYVRNAGKTPVPVQVEMYQNAGFPIIISFQNCNDVPLAPGRTCVVLANDLPDDVTFQCSVDATGSAKNLRGNVELRAITPSGLRVILADELR
jgi:hypothetical protein